MKSLHTISAVIPIYNERSAVPRVIQEIDRFLDAHFADYEVIIVESGSTDGTAEACDALPAVVAKARIVHEGARNGLGSAIRTGTRLATKRWVWPLVVDMPFSLEVILAALPHMETGRSVISYRSADPRNLYRRCQSLVFNTLGRLLLGVHARHINSAFKVTDTALLQSLDLQSNGWLLDAELIMRLEQRGIRYVEIPAELVDRTTGRSTIGPMAAVSAFRDLIRLALSRGRTDPPAGKGGQR